MKFYEYKNHTIYPTPRYITESGNWKVQLTIRHKKYFKIFTYNITFNTKEEAVLNCIDYGKKLIDGGIKVFEQG